MVEGCKYSSGRQKEDYNNVSALGVILFVVQPTVP